MAQIDFNEPRERTEALRRMMLIREFEDAVGDRFADGEIPGFVHLSQGQEGVAVGAVGALTEDDYVTSTHRAHGHSLAKGLDPDRLLAELYGKETGYCDGKGGSMHVASLEVGMLGAQPIVGASVPLGTGAAITAQYTDADWMSLTFLGDGAVAEGQVHEAFNLAATWELPVVFVIENNLYSEGMPFDDQHNIEDLADMAASYGVPGETVDGQDVETVNAAVSQARERALDGEGPTLVEAKTYRYRGHFEGDQEPYRTAEEVDEWRTERDPIDNYVDELLETGVLTEDDVADLERSVESELADAVEFARESETASKDVAFDDVFVEPAPEIAAHRERVARREPNWSVY
ncbi:thiamine pyrophosphate-dependent dehydrogenase E1 component subunit alpha [Haloplanus pelagicus]|jgi:pyruvate dehydrogenase E1 component alpha subunit|uniref:thiamine pyrophosphate-dependent dehydrogenase E1 component subunit alpha n=1 Tax=Haloplanus pelagicus TaxID=2949995 RepID=UPI00203C4E6E|nr:thiamine pyrophosphate-dependent dehydrogenase E1 component subunit alpha [Haloplanus sp. HW8-1]